ncbi:fructosamine kinase family protein [Pseudomaricurvus alcaniphilus]|uniref:fructosamine kinase family protein n=1 Tax=Pseudomaricurvus alcaniphilus TaxID=1166482 RepID=UPI001407CDBC|nr:fructosamine kinase family protein [Pseudomaricurvus alcaniphilus]
MPSPSLDCLSQIVAAALAGRDDQFHATRVRQAQPVSGGDINHSLRLDTDGPTLFLKLNQSHRVDTFAAEMDGLQAIAATETIATCRPLACGQLEQYSYLLLEYLPLQAQGDWSLAGSQLAQMHAVALGQRFGFDRPSYCGGALQPNPWHGHWAAFFANCRIAPQLVQLWQTTPQSPKVAAAVTAVEHLLAEHQPQPSLVHGDLWQGNISFSGGQPVIFDPAIYLGDSETDLAMSELFGRFPDAFYRAYHDQRAIAPGYGQRRDLYQLYHILNHANLFGGAYIADARRRLARLSIEE